MLLNNIYAQNQILLINILFLKFCKKIQNMFKKINDFFKKLDEKIIKGGEEVKQQTHNFKGERFLIFVIFENKFPKNS